MNPDLMRKIDRWLGTSLCLTLTLWSRLMRVLALGSKQSSSPRRILFLELAEIGGLVVAYPALAQARKRFADAELFFLTFKGGQGILDLLGIIDRDHQIIIRPDSLFTFIRDTLAAIWRMRKLGIDTTINLEVYARFSTLLSYLSGAKRRVGFHRFYEEGHYLGDLLTHKVIYNPHHHAARTFVTLVESVAEEVDAEPRAKIPLKDFSLTLPCLSTSDAGRQAIRDILHQAYSALEDRHRLVLLNPNASDLVAARRWPTQNFLEVARGLLQDPGILIVLTGTAEERAHCQKVKQDLKSERVLNLAGQTTLPQLIDLYNQASLLITNDSGPAHFASLTQLPVLVLFGPETPRIYGPLGPQVQVIYLAFSCSPCVSVYNQKRSPCQDNQCLKKITPQQVLKHAQEILTRPGHH